MAEKELFDLPPSYINLGYNEEPVAGPSAPVGQDAAFKQGPSTVLADPAFIPTATAPPAPAPAPAPRIRDLNPSSLVFEDIYDACVQYVKDHCCYGSRFINRMKLTEIDNKRALIYRLESYGEKRETTLQTVPYKGGSVDGPENGRAPKPWDMTVIPPNYFQDCDRRVAVPHTEHVKTCPKCDGSGKVTCSSCWGRGKTSCSSCSGSGRDSNNRSCSSCHGSGKKRCFSCSGSGKVTCGKCDGYGKVKEYTVLVVTWKRHPEDFVTDTNQLPFDVIFKGDGAVLFTETSQKLEPLTNAPDEIINAVSARLLRKHEVAFPNELVIRQRHTLRAVPFTRVKYTWKDKEGEFYVYGTSRKVYFENYPQQCCCCTCC